MKRKHGLSKTKIYGIWKAMIRRCYNQNCKEYRWYGAKGITVCDSWREDAGLFLSDMGLPQPNQWLDRIDTQGNYGPDNCRWTTPSIQQNNKSNNHVVISNGKKMSLTMAAREAGLLPSTVKRRLYKGWDLEKALKTPALKWNTPEGKNRKAYHKFHEI